MSRNVDHLLPTLGNREWVEANRYKLRLLFPEQWTPAEHLSALRIGFELKLLGVDWRSAEDLVDSLVFLHKIGGVYMVKFRKLKRCT